MPSELGHPLQIRAHPQARHNRAQVGGDRLLAGQQNREDIADPRRRGVMLVEFV